MAEALLIPLDEEDMIQAVVDHNRVVFDLDTGDVECLSLEIEPHQGFCTRTWNGQEQYQRKEKKRRYFRGTSVVIG